MSSLKKNTHNSGFRRVKKVYMVSFQQSRFIWRKTVDRMGHHKKYSVLKPFMVADSISRKHLLQDRRVMCCLCEISHNVLKGNVSLDRSQKAKATRYKQTFRKLANKKVSFKTKQNLIQRGGFLPFLIPLIAKAVLPAIVGGGISAAVKRI